MIHCENRDLSSLTALFSLLLSALTAAAYSRLHFRRGASQKEINAPNPVVGRREQIARSVLYQKNRKHYVIKERVYKPRGARVLGLSVLKWRLDECVFREASKKIYD